MLSRDAGHDTEALHDGRAWTFPWRSREGGQKRERAEIRWKKRWYVCPERGRKQNGGVKSLTFTHAGKMDLSEKKMRKDD